MVSQGDNDTKHHISEALKTFDKISVREQRTTDNVKQLADMSPDIVLDPTWLLSKEECLSIYTH